jgi:hypothetical protein
VSIHSRPRHNGNIKCCYTPISAKVVVGDVDVQGGLATVSEIKNAGGSVLLI